LIASALVLGISLVGTAAAGKFTICVLWRMMAWPLALRLSPMYIAEVSPAALRGRLASLNQLTIVVGIFLAQTVNFHFREGMLI
jgi:hypothetical protein